MTMCGILVIASVTVNCLVALHLLLLLSLKLGVRIRAARTCKLIRGKQALAKRGDLEQFIKKNSTHLASLLTDGLANLTLFLCGLYMLTAGKAITQPFATPSDNTDTASFIFSMAIGRLCFAFVVGLLRMRTMQSARSASFSVTQCVEHAVALVALALVATHGEALLASTLLLIMGVDVHVYTCSLQLEGMRVQGAAGLRLGLQVLQCFLSLAFRLVVPLVCLTVALATSGQSLTDMSSGAMATMLSSAIFYSAYNSWVMYHGVWGLWRACASRTSPPHVENQSTGYLVNNTRRSDRKPNLPLTFNIAKDNFAKSHGRPPNLTSTFTDLAYVSDMPPPYENYRRLPTTPGYFRHLQPLQDISQKPHVLSTHDLRPPLVNQRPNCDSISNPTNQQRAPSDSQSTRRKKSRATFVPILTTAGLQTIPEDKESLASV